MASLKNLKTPILALLLVLSLALITSLWHRSKVLLIKNPAEEAGDLKVLDPEKTEDLSAETDTNILLAKQKTETTTAEKTKTSQSKPDPDNKTKVESGVNIKTPTKVTKNDAAEALNPSPTITSVIIPNWDQINQSGRMATVNILCTSPSGGLLNPVSGSGVFISERGVILTNAHIGQYFLLDKYNNQDFIDCVVRTGSPAYPTYKAKLLFISTKWLAEHAKDIVKQNNTGTGEYDYALLLVTGSAGPSTPLPEKFPFLPPVTTQNTEQIGAPILINAYPAGFFGGITIQTNLNLVSSASNIKEIFTFASTSVDLITLTGNVNAQKGASGGAVVNALGELLAIVATSSDAPQTSERNLGAITLSYIDRVLKEEIDTNLEAFLALNLNATEQEFYLTLKPGLSKMLLDVIEDSIR